MEKLIRYAAIASAFLLTAMIVYAAVDMRIEYLSKNRTNPFLPQYETAVEKDRQLACLAINIYREAGNEPFEGKVGVAQVTLNRVASHQFPNDVCQVVYQKNVVMEKVVCQFSWYCDRVHKSRPIDKALYNESYEVAKRVLLEGFKLPSLDQALYYHADYVNPNWRKTKVAKLGRHIFYKDKV